MRPPKLGAILQEIAISENLPPPPKKKKKKTTKPANSERGEKKAGNGGNESRREHLSFQIVAIHCVHSKGEKKGGRGKGGKPHNILFRR